MLITVNGISNKFLKRIVQHIFYLLIVLILVPTFFYFEVFIVLPEIVEQWSTPYYIHFFCAHFLLLNIVGNIIFGMFTNSSIKGRCLDSNYQSTSWDYCLDCDCYRPPRAWHCSTCDICILKRDHHCTFLACCVGYNNHRYFILITFYIFVAMIYAFYFNVQFVSENVSWNQGLIMIKFLLPLVSFVVDFGYETIYVLLIIINFIVGLFTGFLFMYHFDNLIKGKIVHEKNLESPDSVYDNGWKSNIIEVFGTNWYVAWILPFIRSPLPGNGIYWETNKLK